MKVQLLFLVVFSISYKMCSQKKKKAHASPYIMVKHTPSSQTWDSTKKWIVFFCLFFTGFSCIFKNDY